MGTYKTTIPEPCHERWEQMQPTGCGAFCQSCQKEVIDFTNKTSVEIAQIIGKSATPLCGRFTKKQLEHEYEYIPNKLIAPGWFRRGVVGAGLTLLVLSTQTKANGIGLKQPAENHTVNYNLNDEVIKIEEPTDTNKIIVKGKVVDKDNQPLMGAVIRYADTTIKAVATDFEGNFTLAIPANYLTKNNKVEFTISLLGFSIRKHIITAQSVSNFQIIEMEAKEYIMGLTIITISNPTPATKQPETPIEHELWYDYKFNGGE